MISDLTETALPEWVKRTQADRTKGRTGSTPAEREELARLRKENRIPFAFIAAEKARHSVTILCRCLRVTRLRRGPSARAQHDLVLRTKLRAFHAASGRRYGRPRLWKHLQEDAEAVSEKRVSRLLREEQIQGRLPKAVQADDQQRSRRPPRRQRPGPRRDGGRPQSTLGQ